MKHFFIAFFAIATFFSCNKDVENESPAAGRLIEQRTGDEYVKLQYGTNGKIVKAIVLDEAITDGEEVTYNIGYNAAGRISEVNSNEGEVIRLEYENNRLEKAVIEADDEEIGHTDYLYENGILKGAEVKSRLLGQDITTMKFSFTYDQQQRVRRSDLWMINILTDELEPAGYTVMEYDNRKNPLYEFSDFMLLMWQVPAENNVIKETQYYPDDTVDEIREFILTYNAQQYPVQGIFRTIVNGQQVDKNLKFTYN